MERKICDLILSETFFSETFLILKRIERDIINLRRSSCKLSGFWSDFIHT
jgi:hypothetical protein